MAARSKVIYTHRIPVAESTPHLTVKRETALPAHMTGEGR